MKIFLRALGGAVALTLVFVGGGLAWDQYESSKREAFFQERSSQETLSVAELGPLPEEVPESSGLAVSRAYPGIFWTHNDSGDGPRVYALDSDASLVATVDVAGARARDWEDLDLGPCPGGATPTGWCLYIADTGDNARRRESVTVYIVPEPDPFEPGARAAVASSVRISYEGGPFDVEAVAAGPDGGLALATKGRTPTMWVFEASAEDVASAGESGETLLLRSPIALPIEPDLVLGRWITGGSFTAGGSVLALRTYAEVYFYRWPMAAEATPAAPTCFLGPLEPIGEAVAFSSDGRMYLSSESPGTRVGRLLEVVCAGVGVGRGPPGE